MILINRDDLIKQKGKLNIKYDLEEIVKYIDIDNVINAVTELYFLIIESDQVDNNDNI